MCWRCLASRRGLGWTGARGSTGWFIVRQMAVLSDWELWACANEYIRQHGFDAPIHAAMRADELLENGDYDGARNWRLIVHRINQLITQPEARPN